MSEMAIFPAMLLDAFSIALLTGLGVALSRSLIGRSNWLEEASLGFGIGTGLFTWALFLVSWAGLPINRLTMAVVYIGLMAAVGYGLRRWPFAAPQFVDFGGRGNRPASAPLEVVLWLGVVLLVLAAAVLSVGLSYHTWDAAALWAAKGYGISLEGTMLAGASWGNKGLSYPLHLPLLIGVFRLVSGDPLPGSKLVFPLFFAALLIGVYQALRRQDIPRPLALVGILSLGTTPIVFRHATIGYANLMISYYLVLGTLWLAEGVHNRHRRAMLLGGTLLAMATWTRPEGPVLWLAAVVPMVVYAFLRGLGGKWVAPVIVPLAVVWLPWVLFLVSFGIGGTEYDVASLAVQGILRGEIHKWAVYQMVRYLVAQVIGWSVWGLFLPLGTGMILVGLALKRVRLGEVREAAPMLSALLLGLAVFGLYYLTSYDEGLDLFYWLETGFNRQLMPAATLWGVAGAMALGRLLQRPVSSSSDGAL